MAYNDKSQKREFDGKTPISQFWDPSIGPVGDFQEVTPETPFPVTVRKEGTGAELFTPANPGNVALAGNDMELYGAALAERPLATAVKKGTTFTLINDNYDTWISDGTNWRVV